MRHYCTYFDHRYLARGLALYGSLARHAQPFTLFVLCLDEPAREALVRLGLPEVQVIALEEFERGDEALREAKQNRSLVEYYFTCTPSLPLYLFRRFPELEQVIYLDADLYFYASPQPIYEEMGDGSIMLVDTHYPPERRRRWEERTGRYNVGLLAFRNDEWGKKCLAWWRERCLEWCYDRPKDGKFGDQKYLDDWPERFRGVVVAQHRGVNMGPWNAGDSVIEQEDGRVLVNGEPLVCYHFHGVRVMSARVFDTGLGLYGFRLGPALRERVYGPYLRELRRWMERTGGSYEGLRRKPKKKRGLLERLRQGGIVVVIGSRTPELSLRWV